MTFHDWPTHPAAALWTVALLCLPLQAALPDHPRLLFNAAGIDALRQRVAQPEWSARWTSMRSTYDRGMSAPIDLPPRGSNWYHWYVCPKHGVRLTTGRSIGPWRWEHICPTDKEVFLGDPARPQADFDGCALSGIHDGYARAVRDGGLLYQVTGDLRYARRARDILLAYAGKYLDYPLHTTTGESKIGGGRVGPQTLDESVWLIPAAQGADLIWDTLSDADRSAIADRLFRPAARDVILPHRLGIHNIQCWKNSAVGLTGFLLGDDALISAAIDDPDRGYRAQMAKGVQGDGVWFEGAWGYHYYTLSALWSLTEAARNSGLELYGEPLRKMFQAPIQLAMPNLMLPAFNDSTETAVRNSLYELAYARYQDPLYLAALTGADRRNDYALWFGVDRIPDAAGSPFQSLNAADSGYAVLVRGGAWLCLKYGPHGGGHGHPDKNNFVLFARNQVLFPDPGTRLYGSPLHTEWDKATVAHNTLVVDGRNQAEATGKLLAFGANYAMSDAGAIYPGVRFIRTVALPSENLVVFIDRVTADRKRTFDLANHYAGPWTGLPPGSGTTVAYKHVEDVTTRPDGTLRAGPLAITLAANEPTEIITATGPGASTADRVPMSIFRRVARQTTYIWAVSLDGAPVALTVSADEGRTTVRAGNWIVVADTDNATVRIGTVRIPRVRGR
jgi:hypothetical protein